MKANPRYQTGLEIFRYLKTREAQYQRQLKRLVKCNSFTFNPQGIEQNGEMIKEIFRPLEFTGTSSMKPPFEARGEHLRLSTQRLDKPTISLMTHIDTVYPEDVEKENDFTWKKVNSDMIIGPGTMDIKGGTILMAMTLDALRTISPKHYHSVNWEVFCNAAEEILCQDFKVFVESELLATKVLCCLVFENGSISPPLLSNVDDQDGTEENEKGKKKKKIDHNGDDDQIEENHEILTEEEIMREMKRDYTYVVSRKGMAVWGLKVEGKEAHAGNQHEFGANSIVALGSLLLPISKLTDYSKELTFNVGTIQGGTAHNTVPGTASALIEMRAFELEIFNQGIENFYATVQQEIKKHKGCSLQIEKLNEVSPWPRNSSSDTLFQYWEKSTEIFEGKSIQEKRGGLSDGNHFFIKYPTIDGLGPWGANAHCAVNKPIKFRKFTQEYVHWSSFIPKATINALSLMMLIDFHGEM